MIKNANNFISIAYRRRGKTIKLLKKDSYRNAYVLRNTYYILEV